MFRDRSPYLFHACALACATSVALGQSNNLSDLGAVGPALGINNAGQVVLQDYLYSGGMLTPFPAGFQGAAINADGTVAGNTVGYTAAAVYSNGTVTTLPSYPGASNTDELSPGYQSYGINDSGEVVGTYTANGNGPGGWLYSNGTMTFVYPPTEDSTESCMLMGFAPQGINADGAIAGYAACGGGGAEAFVYLSGTWINIGPGFALAINATDTVTGLYALAGGANQGAFLHSSSTFTALPGGAGMQGMAINASGFVVGGIELLNVGGTAYRQGQGRAYFFNGVSIDLNSFVLASDPLRPYVILTDARGINDTGLVVANGIDSRTSAYHAYLLQVPLIRVAPGPLEFSNGSIGSVSSAQSATFTNQGSSTVTLGTTSISGPFSIESNSCNASLAPTSSCTIAITFSPISAGTPAGDVTLMAAGVPITVPVSGTSPINPSLVSSTTDAVVDVPFTLSWSSGAGSSCSASGGSGADGWSGTLAATGSKKITESTANTYVYVVTCTADSLTSSAKTSVVIAMQAPASGGSGAADPLGVAVLFGFAVLHLWRLTQGLRSDRVTKLVSVSKNCR
jgi:hypothetical protein